MWTETGTLAATGSARSVCHPLELIARAGDKTAFATRFRSVACGVSVVLAAFSLLFSGCGYSFQSTTNPWAAKGITKVYIPMMTNNSLRSGIEVPFTSALVKEFARSNRIKLVSDERDADATVQGTVTSFISTANSLSSVAQLSQDPNAQALSDMVIATEYVATGIVACRLVKKGGVTVWSQVFTHPKIYPAGNRFGLQGDTSVLIDASQEQLALQDIAKFIASDILDTMMEAF